MNLNSDKFTKTTSKTNRLRNELSVNTAKCLIMDAENVKHKLEHMYREKSDLVTQLIRMQITSQSLDSKIQTVEVEMNSFKTSLLTEMGENLNTDSRKNSY